MKRNSLFTKVFALVLSLMMVVGCLPMSAFAEQNITEGEVDIIGGSAAEALAMEVLGDGESDGVNEMIVMAGASATYYKWTAIGEGSLSITMPAYAGWSYDLKVNGETVATSNTAAEYPADPYAEVDAGDEVMFIVNSYDNAGDSYNANLTFTASFTYKDGTENAPYIIYFTGENFYEIEAGETVYFSVGLQMAWEGEMTISSEAALSGSINGFIPVQNGVPVSVSYNPRFGAMLDFYVKNESESTASVIVDLAIPLGTYENPDELILGDNTVVDGSQGYTYQWTATEDGELTISTTSENYTFTIVSITAENEEYPYFNGEVHSNEPDQEYPAEDGSVITVEGGDNVTSETVAVKAGDVVVVSAGTYDYSSNSVVINAKFEAAPEETEPEETDPVPEETTPVAKIGEVGYATVAEALNAAVSGETVTMVANSDESAATLIIKPGVILDLVTYSLKAGYVVGLNGSYVTATVYNVDKMNYGKLYVNPNNISLSSAAFVNSSSAQGGGTNYENMPVWYDSYYIFGAARIKSNLSISKSDANNGTTDITFTALFKGDTKALLLSDGEGINNNGVSVIATVAYTNEDGIDMSIEYFWPEIYQGDKGILGGYALSFSLTDCESLDGLEFTLSMVSETGVIIATDTCSYDSL